MADITRADIDFIINKTSDTYTKHYENEIKYVSEKTKLSLWIISLSIGMALFLANKLENKYLIGSLNKSLFYSIGIIFIINMLLGLLIRLKQTRIHSHFLQVITLYEYQRTNMLINCLGELDLLKKVIKDLADGNCVSKIKDLEYINQKENLTDKIIISDENFLRKTDNSTSTLLVLQALLTIIYILINLL